MAEAPEKAAPAKAPLSAPEARTSPGNIVRKAPPGSRRARFSTESRRKGPFVKYVGDASSRRITPTDWASIPGMKPKGESYETNSWGVDNDKIVESSVFSDEQLDYLLIDDLQPASNAHSFLEVDYDDEGNIVQVVYEEDES